MEKKNKGFSLSPDDQDLFGSVADALSDKDNDDDDKINEPGSIDPDEPVDPVDPDEPTDPVDPVDPDDTTGGDDDDPQDPVDPVDPDEPSDKDSSSPLIPYAKMLVEDDILPGLNIDEFDGTADGLKEAMRKEIVSEVETYKESLPQEIKQLIDGYEAGVPFDKILNIKSKQIELSNVTDEQLVEDADLQRKVVEEYYKKTTKFSEDKIKKNIKMLEDLGDLEDEAKNANSELKNIAKEEERLAMERAAEQKKQAEQAYKDAINQANEIIEKADELVPGLKVTKALKEKIKNNITIPVGYDQNGNPISKLADHFSKNPIESEIMLNYLFEVTSGFKDFSIFGKPTKSKVLSELERAAKNLDNKQSGGGGRKAKNASAEEFYKAIENGGFI